MLWYQVKRNLDNVLENLKKTIEIKCNKYVTIKYQNAGVIK